MNVVGRKAKEIQKIEEAKSLGRLIKQRRATLGVLETLENTDFYYFLVMLVKRFEYRGMLKESIQKIRKKRIIIKKQKQKIQRLTKRLADSKKVKKAVK